MDGCVYIGISRDGMIARADGEIDWLDDPGVVGTDLEAVGDMGFGAFMASVDALVMGRNTFDSIPGVADLPESPYADIPIFVLTSRPLDVPDAFSGLASPISGSPREVAAELDGRGVRRAYIDGGQTIQSFLREGLIAEMTLTVLPVLIGEGISLFGALPADILLRLRSSEAYGGVFLQSTYDVVRSADQ